MSFILVLGDHEVALSLPFEPQIEEKLARLIYASREDSSEARLASRIVDVVTSMLDCQTELPTDRQVKYAISIARELNLQIPPEVLQNRVVMTEFLNDHADTYRKSRVR